MLRECVREYQNSILFVEKCLYKHNTYLSSDLSKRLICIFSLSLRSAYQLCNFLLISVVLLCFYIQNFLLLKSGDIESNPGPRKSSTLKFFHWNLNGLAAPEFTKLSLLEGYINVNDIDVICLPETFLDSSIPIDDNRLSIPGYSMMRADHPSNTKRGGECLYYKEHLPIIRRDDTSNLQECLVTEITVKNKRCFLTCLCRSPSQNREQIQSFCNSPDFLMNNINSLNPAISIITGDFNGKCSKWYSFDPSDNIGKELNTITSTAGYSQIIDKPTHFTNNSPTCIDLIFTSNPSILVDSGIEKSLSSSCHHDIIYGKINFRVPLPPPHFRTVWDYKNADAISIQSTVENFNWQNAFGRKIIYEKVQVFSEVLMNILSNYVPQK